MKNCIFKISYKCVKENKKIKIRLEEYRKAIYKEKWKSGIIDNFGGIMLYIILFKRNFE